MLNIAVIEMEVKRVNWLFIEVSTVLFVCLFTIGDAFTLACHFLNDWILKKMGYALF